MNYELMQMLSITAPAIREVMIMNSESGCRL